MGEHGDLGCVRCEGPGQDEVTVGHDDLVGRRDLGAAHALLDDRDVVAVAPQPRQRDALLDVDGDVQAARGVGGVGCLEPVAVCHPGGGETGPRGHGKAQLVDAVFVGDLLNVLQGDLHLLSRAEIGDALGEQVVPLLLDQGRLAAVTLGLLVGLAGLAALHDTPLDQAIATDQVHVVHGGHGRQGEEIGGFEGLVVRIVKPLNHGDTCQAGVYLGDNGAVLQHQGAQPVLALHANLSGRDGVVLHDLGWIDDGIAEIGDFAKTILRHHGACQGEQGKEHGVPFSGRGQGRPRPKTPVRLPL